MEHGPFLDVLPVLLGYLDLKSLVYLSQTSRFWRKRIYNDSKLWPKSIELPSIGHMDDEGYQRHDAETAIQAKLWSMVLPPEDRHALEAMLNKMASSEESVRRFQFVEKVGETIDFEAFYSL